MAIPNYQKIMLPVLELTSDNKEHSILETIGQMYEKFKLSEEEQKVLLPSGQEPVFDNRTRWAAFYLKKAGLLETTRRSHFRITQRGLDILKSGLDEITEKYLRKFPEFNEFKKGGKERKKEDAIKEQESIASEITPQEALEYGFQKIISELANQILDNIKNCSPKFFERLVIDLLVKMGYGGSRKDAGQIIGRSGDEGIDGIIKEDKLGLDIIYVQAKRWNNVVSRPEIQKFSGALQGQRAKKGIFITTSTFSKEAYDYAEKIDMKIILIDGEELAQLMIDNNIGIFTENTYELKKIDSDYFSED